MKVKKLVRLQIQLHIILANVLRHYWGKIKQNNFQNVSFIMTSVAYDFLIGLLLVLVGTGLDFAADCIKTYVQDNLWLNFWIRLVLGFLSSFLIGASRVSWGIASSFFSVHSRTILKAIHQQFY